MPRYLVSGSCTVPFEYEIEAESAGEAIGEGVLRALSEVEGATSAVADKVILDE